MVPELVALASSEGEATKIIELMRFALSRYRPVERMRIASTWIRAFASGELKDRQRPDDVMERLTEVSGRSRDLALLVTAVLGASAASIVGWRRNKRAIGDREVSV